MTAPTLKIKRIESRIEELEERIEMINHVNDNHVMQRRIEELESALRPFAEAHKQSIYGELKRAEAINKPTYAEWHTAYEVMKDEISR